MEGGGGCRVFGMFRVFGDLGLGVDLGFLRF